MSAGPLLKTPLHENHLRLKAKMVPFAGWEMPVQYTSVMEEHLACRNAGALFDVSHMGEIFISGAGATGFLNQLITNDVSTLIYSQDASQHDASMGQALYGLICLPTGGVVDDVIVYRLHSESYFVCVNASNVSKDFEWITAEAKRLGFSGQLLNVSNRYAQIAVQGPNAVQLVERFYPNSSQIKPFHFFSKGKRGEAPHLVVARTGYTGEDGFEIYISPEDAPALWDKLVENGHSLGIIPAGLAARDTLRLEAKLPLYGQELNDHTTPLESKLGFFVKLSKPEGFNGFQVMAKQKETGLPKELIGIELLESGIPRTGYKILDAETQAVIGEITSGTHSPLLKRPIALGFVKAGYGEVGKQVRILIRDRAVLACVAKTPFYKRQK